MPARSTLYYRSHPEARRKKSEYNRELNKRPDQVKKRVESNRARRVAKRKGVNVKGKDYDHAVGRFVDSAVNRGRKEKSRVKGSKRSK